MQAVILAAGEGKRLRPLTLLRPKPLIVVGGRPILEHILDALPNEVDDIILVVGYKADMIKQHFGDIYTGRRITYVRQEIPEGTGHALWLTKPLLKEGRFVFMCGDDIHGARALAEAVAQPLALLAAVHEDPSKFGVLKLNADGTLMSIIEKPEVPPTNLVSTGAMVLDTHIFDYDLVRSENGEYYANHPIGLLAQEHPIMVVKQELWLPIGYPEDIAKAEELLTV
jgi:NDP-sugar pyrophosphorylase family protein